MKIEHLRLFVSVCEQKSISKAAGQAYLSQQSLSTILKHMENELGMKLLYRTNRGIETTEEGKSFWQYCQQIITLYDQFISENKQDILHSEVVKFYTTSAISRIFPDIFEQRFLNKYTLSLYERSNEELRRYVVQKKPGVILLSLREENLAKLGEERKRALHKIGMEGTSICFCHRNAPFLSHISATNLTNLLADRQLISVASDTENDKTMRYTANKTVRVNDMAAYKKLLKNHDAIGLISGTLYYKYFDPEEYLILEQNKIEQLGYYLVCNLGITEEEQLLEKALIRFFEQTFSVSNYSAK